MTNIDLVAIAAVGLAFGFGACLGVGLFATMMLYGVKAINAAMRIYPPKNVKELT